ncbi:MAG TPA: thymidine phosphorylase family protein [Casimicrobiaceae bacterium]|nr:thymidine phosphorylase family protein [Casimicrobiaceae bacterium]
MPTPHSGAVLHALAPRNTLALRHLGIHTYREKVLFMRSDCHICRSVGFTVQSRVLVGLGARSLVATVNMVGPELLGSGEAGLSEAAWEALGAREGDIVVVSHAPPIESLSHLRAKVFGHRLDDHAMREIMGDIVAGRYSDLHLAAFVTACAGDRLDTSETTALTRAMIDVGTRLTWPQPMIVDKHCVGGLPGNRTTLIVVPIVAAAGLTIPKTSSRAITSPAGTADTMEVLAPVALDSAAMRRVVEREGGCIVWGGSVGLSPADDVLISVERPLDLDSEGQLVASVLSKKAAAGSTHVVIDMPVGPTAKVRSSEAAARLGAEMQRVGRAIGIDVRVLVTDGSQPVGRGIGPALEAKDVLAVLGRDADAPADLRARALRLAGSILEFSAAVPPGTGLALATAILDDGRAFDKLRAICASQGGMREPPQAAHRRAFEAARTGKVVEVDNRRLARGAKLAGAPQAPAAGIEFLTPVGTQVERGQPLFVVHAQAPGELAYAFDYLAAQQDVVRIGGAA